MGAEFVKNKLNAQSKIAGSGWILGLVFIGILLRFAAALGELGLDEVWSLNHLRSLESWIGIFLDIHHDNNHYLNSLYIWVIGINNKAIFLRAFSIACGALSIYIAFILGRQRCFVEAILFAALISVSYIFVLYGSEARGYAPMVLSTLAAYFFFLRQRWQLYWVSVFLGYLAHSSILQFFVCLVFADIWSAYKSQGIAQARSALIRRHFVPIFFLSLFIVFFQSQIEIGGGPHLSHFEIGLNTLLAVVGLPELSLFNVPLSAASFIAALIVFIILLRASLSLYSQDKTGGTICLLLVLVFPLVVIFLIEPPVLFVRYFLPGIIFALYLLAIFLAALIKQGRLGQFLTAIFVVFFLVLNLAASYKLIIYGRSSFSAIATYLHQQQPTGPISIAGYPDYRNQLLLSDSVRSFSENRIVYNESEYPDQLSSNWLILQSQDEFFIAAPTVDPDYRCERAWESARYSGIRAFLYRRQTPAP